MLKEENDIKIEERIDGENGFKLEKMQLYEDESESDNEGEINQAKDINILKFSKFKEEEIESVWYKNSK